MFNSVVLDVFIGLVLVYLLYSLLITILGEMFSTWMGIRSRLLRVSIEKMLNDGYVDEHGKLKYANKREVIKQFFLKEYPDFKNSFAGKFYELPGIKYLVDTAGERKTFFTQTKPSYLSAGAFSESMVQLLRDKGSGTDDMQRICFCLQFNTHHIQPQTLKRLRDIAHDAGGDIAIFKKKLEAWYNETQDRATGWYKRKMQVILFTTGFIIAAYFNVDTIQIARKLSKDKNARAQMVNMAVELAKDSARYQAFLSNNGASAAQATIDSGWANINNDIQDASYALGMGWNLSKLTKRADVEIPQQYSAQVYKIIDANTSIRETLDSIRLVSNDSARKVLQSSLKTQEQQRIVLLNQMNISNATGFVQITSLTPGKKNMIKVEGQVPYGFCNKAGYIALHLLPFNLSFWGLVITGLMLSLGAPFWFDLLKKLVAIRGAGVKPEEKDVPADATSATDTTPASTKSTSPQPVVIDKKEPIETALENLTEKLRQEPGIVALAIDPSDNPATTIIIYVENQQVATYLTGKYGTTTSDRGKTFLLVYEITSTNEVHLGTLSGAIGNKTMALGHGTLGCFLANKKDNNKYLLSCWHVLKDNNEWTRAILQRDIIDSGNAVIGSVVHGYLSDTDGVDVGIALCNDQNTITNHPLPINAQHREVRPFDGLTSTAVKFKSRFNKPDAPPVDATIFHYKINAQIKYPDGKLHTIEDVFTITVKDPVTQKKKAPSRPGDSGAVVVDAKNTPLGMVIGGNDTFTYVIKFTNVFSDQKPYKEYYFITDNNNA